MSPTRPSASSGQMGRRCTVPPSAAMTSASQCGGGGGIYGAGGSVVCWSVTWVVRIEAEVGEGGTPGPQDGAVDAGLGERVPVGEAGVAALGHVRRRARAQPAADDVLPPGLGDLAVRVEGHAAGDGEQVRPGPG